MSKYRFYATGGRGTESFIAQEINEKLGINNQAITGRDGKVFFEFEEFDNVQVEDILNLKCPERVFVSITDYSNEDFHSNKRLFLDKLMQELSNNDNYTFTKQLFEHFVTLDNFHKDSVRQNIIGSKRKVYNNRNETSTDSDSKRIKVNQLLEKETVDQNILYNGTEENTELPECEKKTDEDTKTIDEDTNKTEGHEPLSPDLSCENTEQSININNSVHSIKDLNTHIPTPQVEEITFRMSIKCSGKLKRKMELERLSRDLAWRVARSTGWSCLLRDPLAEVCVHISDNFVTAGVPLTKNPLSKRKFIKDSGLRSSICWIMVRLAGIQKHDRVLDPMCGKGTLLLEAGAVHKEAHYLGTDIDEAQLATAHDNVRGALLQGSLDLLAADCQRLPFEKDSFDSVVCDAPFGQNHKIDGNAGEFYQKFLYEVCRVLKCGGKCVVLTSQILCEKIRLFVLEYIDQEKNGNVFCLSFVSDHYVKLGETNANIIVLKKNIKV